MSQNLLAEDDGLPCPDVGSWAETKNRLLAHHDELFSTGMKNKWDQRVYIDLYAGSGNARVKGTGKVLKGSPVLALSVSHPFDKYIFCEENEALLLALKARVARLSPQANAAYIHGSCDAKVEQICREIPKGSSLNKVLSLCLVDPFDFGIKFERLRRLSIVFVDFVVLLAIGMDANCNYEHYVDGDSPKLDEALGNTEWRERWKAVGLRSSRERRRDFRQFLAAEFSMSMKTLEHLEQPLDRMKLVRSAELKGTCHASAFKFWEDVLKYSGDQMDFFR